MIGGRADRILLQKKPVGLMPTGFFCVLIVGYCPFSMARRMFLNEVVKLDAMSWNTNNFMGITSNLSVGRQWICI